MTIGLTWRRTARRIKRLKGTVLTISPDYSDRSTPDFLAPSRKALTGFNPKTQQKIRIPAKTVVKFRVAKVAKDTILGAKK